jgi:hypothetical protein
MAWEVSELFNVVSMASLRATEIFELIGSK